MAIESVELVRRAVRKMWGIAIAGLLSACAAVAQAPLTPQQVTVTSGSVVPFSHGSTGAWGQIYALKIAHNGSVLFLDSSLSELYQLAPGATAANLVIGSAAAGKQSNGSTLEASGSYYNAGIALDAQDTLYVTDRYGSAVQFQCVPTAPRQGPGFSTPAQPGDSAVHCLRQLQQHHPSPGHLHRGRPNLLCLAVGDQRNRYVHGERALRNSAEREADCHGAEDLHQQRGSGSRRQPLLSENVYTQTTKRANGVLMIPAATVKSGTTLVGASDGSSETTWLQNGTMKRIDPASAGYNFKAMTFDAQGDLYLSSENDQGNYGGNVDMVLMVPNEGTPTAPNLVWNDAVGSGAGCLGLPDRGRSSADSCGFQRARAEATGYRLEPWRRRAMRPATPPLPLPAPPPQLRCGSRAWPTSRFRDGHGRERLEPSTTASASKHAWRRCYCQASREQLYDFPPPTRMPIRRRTRPFRLAPRARPTRHFPARNQQLRVQLVRGLSVAERYHGGKRIGGPATARFQQ